MKKIKLSQGKCALVDNKDYEWLNQYRWHAYKKGGWYARRQSPRDIDGKQYGIQMHRYILGLEKGNSLEIDHINGNGLDNRRQNLRIATSAQNKYNMRTKKGSPYKGVVFHKGGWQSQLTLNRKQHYLGGFKSAEGAARMYNYFAKICFGEYACLNEGIDANFFNL